MCSHLLVIQLLDLVPRLAADVDAQALVELGVLLREDDGEVCLAAPQIIQLFSTRSAKGLVTAEMDRAMSTSSECRRGLWWPRCRSFMSLMGAMMEAGSRSRSLSMPARSFTALRSMAAEGPRRELVLPVTTRPSGSTIAPAGRRWPEPYPRRPGPPDKYPGLHPPAA